MTDTIRFLVISNITIYVTFSNYTKVRRNISLFHPVFYLVANVDNNESQLRSISLLFSRSHHSYTIAGIGSFPGRYTVC